MSERLTPADLREAAAECIKSSVGNGGYNDAFYVAHIVLNSLAEKLAAKVDAAMQERGA